MFNIANVRRLLCQVQPFICTTLTQDISLAVDPLLARQSSILNQINCGGTPLIAQLLSLVVQTGISETFGPFAPIAEKL